jgi:hypothetical protein
MTEEGFEGMTFLDDGRESKITKVAARDMEAIERLLDVRRGALSGKAYFFESKSCKCECEKNMTMYDFVFTALLDAAYSKSFVLHNLLSMKYVAQKNPETVRCSLCGATGRHKSKYKISHYGYYDTAA